MATLAKAGEDVAYEATPLGFVELDEHAGVIQGEVHYKGRTAWRYARAGTGCTHGVTA